MAFPTIPTTAGNTLLSSTTTPASTTHTFPSLTTLAPAAGDLIIAICVQYQGGTANAEFGTWGASLTETADLATVTALDQAIGVAHKVASGSESGTFTVTSAHSFKSVNFLMRIPAATWHGTTIPEVAAAVRATNAVADPGSLDPANWAAEDTLWIAVYGHSETSTTGSPPTVDTPPTNYSGQLIVARAADAVGEITAGVAFYQNNASSENAGTWTVTNATRGNGAATTIAVRPTPAVPADLPLATAAATSSATLALTAPATVVLSNSDAVATASLAVFTPTLARYFDDVDDYIQTAIGGANVTTDLTFAALVRSHASGEFSPIFGQHDAADTTSTRSGIEISTGNALQIRISNTASIAPSITMVPADGWVVAVITKAAGSTFPRFHIYKAGAWTHEDYSALARPDPNSAAGGKMEFARLGTTATLGDIDLAVAGVWNSVLSDANIETLVTNRATQDWMSLSPQALWDFGQASVATNVTDLTGGGADQSAITGTTAIDTGPSGWVYGVAAAAIVPLGTSAAQSSATLALTAPTTVPLGTSAAVSSATLALTAPATIALATAAATSSATLALNAPALLSLTATGQSSATLALTAQTRIVLQASDAVSSATLTLTAPTIGAADVVLQPSSAVSSATLALTALTKLALDPASAVSSATLALRAPATIALGAASGQSSATLALTTATTVPLGAATATSSATLALRAQTKVPLAAASGVSSATLSLTALTKIPLDPASAVSSATCNVTSPGVAFLTLTAASGTATATLGLTAPTKLALGTASATSSATLSLTAPARVPLAATTATSSATLALTILPSLVLTTTATSSATLSLTAKTTIPIAASTATSSATLALRAAPSLVLTAATATSSATLVVTTSAQIPLEAVTASSSATLALGILAAGTLLLAPCYATSSATLVVVGIDTSWHNDSDTSWPNQTDTRWPVGVEAGWGNDEGTVWPNSTDQDWS